MAGLAPGETPPKRKETPSERDGPYLRISVDALLLGALQSGLELGWTFGSKVGVFVTGAVGAAGDTYISSTAGARLWLGPVYLHASVGMAHLTEGCPIDELCIDDSIMFGAAGIGYELGRQNSIAADVLAQVLMANGEKTLMVGFGVTRYF